MKRSQEVAEMLRAHARERGGRGETPGTTRALLGSLVTLVAASMKSKAPEDDIYFGAAALSARAVILTVLAGEASRILDPEKGDDVAMLQAALAVVALDAIPTMAEAVEAAGHAHLAATVLSVVRDMGKEEEQKEQEERERREQEEQDAKEHHDDVAAWEAALGEDESKGLES